MSRLSSVSIRLNSMEFSFCFRIWWAVFLFAVLPIRMYAESLDSLHIAVLGDSNTWLGGDDCSQPRGWTTAFVRALHPASCRSYARSGATWTHTSATSCRPKAYTERLADDNVIFNQMVRMADTCGNQRCLVCQGPPTNLCSKRRRSC